MSIKRTIITTIVALAVVAMVAPGVAQGVTIDELLAQIAQLQAQLLALQSGGTTTGGSAPAVCAGVTFTRNLTVGSTGSDVKCLQALLNKSASTQVATTGAGSPGSETTYFGSKTLVAVKKYQAEQGFTPANQVGPLTRARLNTALAGTGGTTGGTTPVVIVPTGAGLTVQLASNNPAANTIVDGQSQAPMARLVFVNGDNAEVKVTALKLKRIGISADASVANLYLFDGATRLTDGAAVSSTVVNFNNSSGLFTVPAGGSRTISLLADISAANAVAGETMALQVVASTDVTTNASSVKGTFPITGNLMTIASGTLAGVEFNATTTPSDATIDPQNDYTIWQNSVVVTTRAVDMTRISFRKTGSVKDSDLQNFRLYVDGVQVGSTIPNIVLSANNESLVTFDLTSSPKRLEAGTRVIKLLADIIGGSSLTFQFHLWNVADSTFVDSQYGANLTPDLVSDAAFTKRSAGTSGQTVGSGTITFTKMTDSPSGNIVNLASNALLAKFQVKAAGEKVKIETLYVSAVVNTSSVSGLRNGMLLANGVQIGSTTTLYDPDDSSYDYTTFNLGSSLIVEPGSPVTLEVKADIYDTGTSDTTNSIVANSTIQVTIEGSSAWNNATGQTSSTTIDAPAADVTGNTLTVAAGGLTLSKYTAYTNQSMVPPLTAAKIGHFTLTANTTEAVNVTSIEVNLDDVTSTYATNLYVKFGDQVTSTKASITAVSNSWSVNYSIAAGETKNLLVYADINSNASGGTGDVSVYIAGTTASSATAVTAGTTGSYTSGTTGVQSQSITYTTGSLTPAVDGTTPLAAIVAGGQQVVAGKFKFTSLYDAYTIKELRFSLGAAATSAAINNLILKDGDTVLATVPYDGANSYFNITGLTVAVPASTTKVLTVVYDLSSSISSSTSTSQVDAQPDLDYIKYATSQGAETTSGTDYDTAKAVYVFKSIPTVAKDTTITGGSVTAGTPDLNLYGWKVTASSPIPNASIAVKQTKLTLSWSDAGDAGTLQLYAFKLYKNGSDITSLVAISDEDGHALETTTAVDGANEDSSTIIITWNVDPYEDTIAAGTTATYKLTATASGFTATASKVGTDTVSVSMPTDATVNTGKYLTNSAQGDPDDFIELCSSAEVSDSTDANFIWSDVSDLSHDASESEDDNGTASTSADWANGYLVQSLPLSTNTFIGP